jgi:predicted phosphodiesterase
MRVALISDIHGNDLALSAVRESIAREGVDQIVCLGDVATLGSRPGAVLAMLREMGCACIKGNHDAFMLEPELVHGYAQVPIVVEAVDWTRSQLSAGDLEMVSGFVPSIEIPLSAEATLFLFHGTPRSHMEDLLATTPPDDLDRMLDGHRAAVMAGGHTHVQMVRQHRGALLVNPGSVGMPFREYVERQAPTLMAHAEYAIVEARGGDVEVTLRRVPLDRTALRRASEVSENPLAKLLVQQYA